METKDCLDKNNKYAYLLFLISPFISLIVLAKNYRSNAFNLILLLFFAFMGLILVINDKNSDAFRYSESFEMFSRLEYDDKVDFFNEEFEIDFFRPLTFHLVSLFSSNGKIYFAFISLFYGFFYVGILKHILNAINTRVGLFEILLIINFTFILPFLGFKFVRFSTATVVFIYFLLNYFITKDKKFVLFTAFSVLVHFSFLLPVIFLIGYLFLPKKIGVIFVIYLISNFISFFDFAYLKNIIEIYLPQELESKKTYLNEDYKELVDSGFNELNWYIRYRAKIISNTAILLLLYLFFKRKLNIIKYQNVLCFALSFGIIANIISVVPSGFRFLAISNSLIWFVLTVNILHDKLFIINKTVRLIAKFTITYNVVVGLRYLTEDMPVEFFIGNPILAIFGTTNIAMIELIKSFL